MKFLCVIKFVIAIIAVATFISCKDYLDNTNGDVGNGRIGLPGNVHIVNTENSNSRAIGENSIPNIHTRTSVGGKNPVFLRYTTSPGIMTNSKTKSITGATTRGTSITTNNFYDSYSLFTCVYSGKTTWASIMASSNITFHETYFDQQVELGKAWVTDQFWPGNNQKCAFFCLCSISCKRIV